MDQEVRETQPERSDTAKQLVTIGRLRRQLESDGLMRVDGYEVVRPPDVTIAFRGQIQEDTDTAFEQIVRRFAGEGYTAWLRDRSDGGREVVATKGVSERRPGRVWVNLVLFLATVVTTLFIGGTYGLEDPALVGEPQSIQDAFRLFLLFLRSGIPFAATLLAILVTHELSHYFVGSLYGSPQSLPYFIPFPNILGTMGAVIVQRKPMQDRKAVLDIGMAGPIGGLIVAIPLLILGLSLSEVGPPPPGIETAWQEGNSLLYVGLKYLVFGRFLPNNGIDVWLHPVAFAAWAGLWVTMMNLVPVGQLDGGHVSYALLGRKAHTLGLIAIAAMVVLGGWLVLNGNAGGGFWVTWGLLNLVLNRRHPPSLNDATDLGWLRIFLGVVVLLVFALLFMPAPLQQVIF